jgi:serine/threonine protein kinase
MIGQTLAGRFTIVGLVGVGSMGKVYRAVQRGTERNVALKVLKRERAQDTGAKARFLREARASSSLASPHTVRIFDFGESEQGELFLAMELLEGENLLTRIKRDGRLGYVAAVETTLGALKSLEEAHAKGLIHRDLKPANLFYARVTSGAGFDEITKVLDFGGAKFIAPEGKPLNALDTQEGFVVGTPRYMSPEQAEGRTLDPRSDLYSLGAVLYHMLAGRAPFIDDDPELVLAKQIRTVPEPISVVCPDAVMPRELEGLVMRVLAKNRDARPKDATAFAQELAQFLDGPPSTRLSAGVLRASVPPPSIPPPTAGASASGPSGSSPSGSGRRSVPPSNPSGSPGSRVSSPGLARPSAPSEPPPTSAASGSPARPVAIDAQAESADLLPAHSTAEPDAEVATLPFAAITDDEPAPRRVGRWIGGLGLVVAVAVVAWFAMTSRSGSAPFSTRTPAASALRRGSPPASGAAALAPSSAPSSVASGATGRATSVPVETLPRARPGTTPPPARTRSNPGRPTAAPATPAEPPAPSDSAPPAAPSASSNYNYFE